MKKFEIRPAAAADSADVIALMLTFAEYERLEQFVEITEERLAAAAFGPERFVEILIALVDGQSAGYALFYPNFASFRGQRGYYLEDLFVADAFRGMGIGEALIREIARLGNKRGFERIDFQVLEWNASALNFYAKLGAVRDDTERHLKFTDEVFERLAGL